MRRRVLTLAALAAALVGSPCTPGQAPGPPTANLYFDPPSAQVAAGSVFTVDVVVNASAQVQAWEIAMHADPPLALPFQVLPHPQFDDDGALFVAPAFDLPRAAVSRIVDLRHGPAANGTFRLVTVRWFAATPGTTTLRLAGGLATGEGTEVEISAATSTIEVVAP